MAITGSDNKNVGASYGYKDSVSYEKMNDMLNAVGTGKSMDGAALGWGVQYKDVAGVTAEMAENIVKAIDDNYLKNINEKMAELNTLAVVGGLQGTNLETSVKDFIGNCVNLCSSLVNDVVEGEKAIVKAVKEAYAEEQKAIAKSMDDDAPASDGGNANANAGIGGVGSPQANMKM